MKWIVCFSFLFSLQLHAEVSPEHVDQMIDQMVSKNVISKEEAEKAKARMRSMSADQWSQINAQATKIAARSPASAEPSQNRIEEVNKIDLDSAQFKAIQNDIAKIVPKYKD
jgi:polyhydroxyalkanoate synthesis regulator phasin